MVNKIKKYLLKNNISQSSFARIIGTNRFTMSRWIKGKHKPSQAYKKIIQSVLNNK
jgi:DNA-binding transcriptional regulator YiaG